MRAIHPHSPHGFTAKPLTRTTFSYLPYHLAGLLSGPFFFKAKSNSAVLRQPF